MLSFFPLDVLDEMWDVIVLDEMWDLIESVSEGFLTYSLIAGKCKLKTRSEVNDQGQI